jgi:hypothetical protein
MGVPNPDTNNSQIVQAFGASASGVSVPTLPIPIPSQTGVGVNIASFHDGFPPATMTPIGSGGQDMRGPDMQGILYMLSLAVAALQAGQLQAFNSTREGAISGYAPGAILLSADTLGLWLNQAGTANVYNPDTSPNTSGWCPILSPGQNELISGLTNANVTLTAPQWKNILFTFTGTLTGNVSIIFPPIAGMSWIVMNNTTGAFSLTCKTASGTGIVVPQGGGNNTPYLICSDGVNILSPSASAVSGGIGQVLANYSATNNSLSSTALTVNTITGLTPSATYFMEWDGTISSSGGNYLTAQLVPNSGTPSYPGLGFCLSEETGASSGSVENGCQSLGVQALYNANQVVHMTGHFVNPAGNTSVTYQLSVAGSASVQYNSLRLTRVA